MMKKYDGDKIENEDGFDEKIHIKDTDLDGHHVPDSKDFVVYLIKRPNNLRVMRLY